MAKLSKYQVLKMTEALEQMYADAAAQLLINIAEHLKPDASLPDWAPTVADYQEWAFKKLADIGKLTQESVEIIKANTGLKDAEIKKAIAEALGVAVADVDKICAGRELIASGRIAQVLENLTMQAIKDTNIVNTVMLESTLNQYRAAVMQIMADQQRAIEQLLSAGDLEALLQRLDSAQGILNTATTGLTMGTTTLQDAVAKAVHRLAETGITGFIDKGGHQWTPEAYVSMDLRTTLHNTYIQGQQARSAEFGISTFQISSHPASRPLCAPYQGWICSWDNVSGVVHDLYGNAYVVHPISETSYGEPAGIFGINCGHEPETFIDGISVPRSAPLTGAELEQDNEEYLLTQKQRALERRVRQYRTEAVALHAAGQPIPPELALKVKSAQSRLSEFCQANGLIERRNRTQVTGYNRSVGVAVGKAAKKS
nr:MAG TPA: minor capsid protein [Caudoviricetes sp.]